LIQLKDITKTFHQKGRTIHALANVSLHVPKGKIFGVIGASGAGKSTLIRCVNLLETPTSGEVIVDGQLLTSLSRNELAAARRNIGMIFQHFNLLSSRTVRGNIAFPLELEGMSKLAIESRVAELAELVGLQDKLNEYPVNLSGGQKQRVAIARTLATHPKVILCDEATSALDPATTESILQLLKDINQRLDITILLITHEMNVVKTICDEVAVISNGALIEQGAVSTVFSRPQTALTKAFLSAALNISIPNELQNRLNQLAADDKNQLLKLVFSGESADTAILSDVAVKFGVQNKIVSAQLDYVGSFKFGAMLLEVTGTAENRAQAIAYYQALNIGTEVLGYV
jgi:D-methionine transport system ATP-binding protein